MKTLTTMTAAAMLIAGMSFAGAQNAPGPTGTTANPSNLNAASSGEAQIKKSGSQSANPAMKSGMKTSQQNGANGATSPADINARPSANGTGKSGSESKATAKQGNGMPTATTGAASSATSPVGSTSSTSPGAPNAKPAKSTGQ